MGPLVRWWLGWFLAALFCTNLVHSAETVRVANPAVVAIGELPREGQETYRLILAGGPFRYEKDGTVFGNREKQLPVQPRGFYREYTVRTPGQKDRGAQRIVCGGRQAQQPDACYYTADHYASFRLIIGTR